MSDKGMESLERLIGELGIEKVREALGRESYTTTGVLEDFVQYEVDRILQEISGIKSRIQHLGSVMESRHRDNLKIIDDLMRQNKELKAKLKEQS